MKKIAILLLTVVSLSLSSCGGSKEEKCETTNVDSTCCAKEDSLTPVTTLTVDSTITVSTKTN